jgi:uncharacterized membrane protein
VRWSVAALVLFVIVFALTLAVNVPLNEEIDRAGDPDRIADLAQVRDDFEGPWVIANIVRTVLSAAAVAAVGVSLVLHRSAARDRIAPAAPRIAEPAAVRSS